MIQLKEHDLKTLYQKTVSKKYAVDLKPLEEGEKASILSDTMFKTMFQNENRLKYSCKLLSYFLEIRYEDLLANIHLCKNELDKKKKKEKQERCDYVASIDNTYFNIEVNNNSNLESMERNIEYLLRLYAKNVQEGKKYEYTHTIGFQLNNFSFQGEEKVFDLYTLQNEEQTLLTDKLIIIQIYVPNLRKKWYTKGKESLLEVEKYLLALVERKIEDIKDLGGDEVMEEYIKESEEVCDTEGFGEAYDKEWALKDEGFRDGKRELGAEIAKELLQEGMKIEKIASITKLTEEEVEEIYEEEKENLNLEETCATEGFGDEKKEAVIEIIKELMKDQVPLEKISQYTSFTIEEINQLLKEQ